jgi:CHAD domain-containing protein
MAALRRRRSGAKAVCRAIRSESRKALESLTEVWPPADERIHYARKRIKRARAGLRLLRDNLGESAYRRENAMLRDAARPLSEIRDAKILVAALDRLARGDRRLQRETDRLRSLLVARRMRARRRVLKSRATLEPALVALRSARKELAKPRGGRGWSTLGPGLRRVYRSGRRAAAATEQRATDENLHELRKQAKYLWHELQILAPIQPATLGKLAELAHQCSRRLGDDHDLALLRQQVSRSRSLSRSASRSIVASIDRRRRRLQQRAHLLGRRLYRERPREFEKRLGCYWRTWRSGGARGSRGH